jgi:hypothetical protein
MFSIALSYSLTEVQLVGEYTWDGKWLPFLLVRLKNADIGPKADSYHAGFNYSTSHVFFFGKVSRRLRYQNDADHASSFSLSSSLVYSRWCYPWETFSRIPNTTQVSLSLPGPSITKQLV